MEERDQEWIAACAEAGSLLLSSDDDGNITGHQVSSKSGGRNYIGDFETGFPRELSLMRFGDSDAVHGSVRYVAVEKTTYGDNNISTKAIDHEETEQK